MGSCGQTHSDNMGFKPLLLLALVAVATAAPSWTNTASAGGPKCQTTCPISPSSKFHYQPGTTYIYDYTSASSLQTPNMKTIDQGQMNWSAKVHVHYRTACEVVVEIREPKVEQQESRDLAEKMTKYPMEAISMDGIITKVCSDEREPQQIVNIKKGLLSIIQNSLPSNGTLNDGMELMETDIQGVCPTKYRVIRNAQGLIVEKSKDHTQCTQRVGGLSQSPLSGLFVKSPPTILKSKSFCSQHVISGKIEKVECLDTNNVAVFTLAHTKLIGVQKSVLIFKSMLKPNGARAVEQAKESDLIYKPFTPMTDARQNMVLETKLRTLCDQIKNNMISRDNGAHYLSLLYSMDRVEHEILSHTLQKIESGHFCSETKALKGLYMDALTSTYNPGAIKVLVSKILQKERVQQFTFRLHSAPRISKDALRSLRPIFEREESPKMAKIAAGTAVMRYCQNEKCSEQSPAFAGIMDIVNQKLSGLCHKTDETSAEKAVTYLKSVGNMKHATPEVRSTIISCFKSSQSSKSVKLQAAETLRQLPCSTKATNELLPVLRRKDLCSRVAIYAYKAIVQCLDSTQIPSLVQILDTTSDIEVKSFIASDLINLQNSEAPYKAGIRNILSSYDFGHYSTGSMKSSHSYEYSSFTGSQSFGAEFATEVLYKAQQKIPKEMRANLTIDILKQIINLGEIGIRVENLPAILKNIVSPNSMLGKTKLGEILNVIMSEMEVSSDPAEIDVLFKSGGQELIYQKLSDLSNENKDILKEMMGNVMMIVKELYNERMWGFQPRYELQIPTMQGIPFFFAQELSVVATLMTNNGNNQAIHQISPKISALLKHHIGYKFMSSIAMEMNTTIHSSGSTQISIQHPTASSVSMKVMTPEETMNNIEFYSSATMRKDSPDGKVYYGRKSARDPRKTKTSCFVTAGVKSCMLYDIADQSKETDYPFVKPSKVVFKMQKENPAVRGIVLSAGKEHSPASFGFRYSVIKGTEEKKLDMKVALTKRSASHEVVVQSDIMGDKYSTKIEVGDQSTSGNKRLVANVIYGPSNLQKVFETTINLSKQEFTIVSKTMGKLKEAVSVDLTVDATRNEAQPLLLKVNKFELDIQCSQHRFENSMKLDEHSPNSAKHTGKSILKWGKQPVWEVKPEMSISYSNGGWHIRNEIQGKISQQLFSTALDIVNNHKNKSISIVVNKSANERPFILSLSQSSERGMNHQFQLKSPQNGIDLMATSRISENDFVQVLLTSQSQEKFSVRGPLTYHYNGQELTQKSELGVRVGGKGPTYNISTDVQVEKNRAHNIKITASKDNMLLIALDTNSQFSLPQIRTQNKLNIPSIVSSEVSLENTAQETKMNTEILLVKWSPRKIESSLSLRKSSPNGGIMSASLFMDKSKQPEKGIQVSGSYDLRSSATEGYHLTLRGDAMKNREKYNYMIRLFEKHSEKWAEFDNDVSITLIKGSKKMFDLRSMHSLVKKGPNSFQLTNDITVGAGTQSSTNYGFQQSVEHTIFSGEKKIKYNLEAIHPKIGKTVAGVTLSRKLSQGFSYNIQVEAENKLPEDTTGRYNVQSMMNVMLNTDNKLETINSETMVKLRGTVHEINISNTGIMKSAKLSVMKNKQVVVGVKVERRNAGQITSEIQLPSRVIAMEGNYGGIRKVFRIYNDKQNKNRFIGIQMMHGEISDGWNMQLRLKYPSNTNQKSIIADLRSIGGQMIGQIKFDISPRSGEGFKLIMNGRKLQQGPYEIETSIVSEKTSRGPKVQTKVWYDDNGMSLEASYKRSDSAAPNVLISSSYVKQTAGRGVMSLKLKAPNNMIEIDGTLTGLNSYGCVGRKIMLRARNSNMAVVPFEIITCKPWFMEVKARESRSTDEHVMKLGLQSFSRAEISLTKVSHVLASGIWREMTGSETVMAKNPIVKMAAIVDGYRLITSGALDMERLIPTMGKIKDSMHKIRMLIRIICLEVRDEMAERYPELSFLTNKIPQLGEDIIYCIEHWGHLFEEKISPKIQMVKRTLFRASNIVRREGERLMEMFKQVCTKMQQWARRSFPDVTRKIKELYKSASSFFDKIKKWLKDLKTEIVNKFKALEEKVCQKCPSICKFFAWLKKHLLLENMPQIKALAVKDESIQRTIYNMHQMVEMVERKELMKLAEMAVMAVSKQNMGVFWDSKSFLVSLPLKHSTSNITYAAPHLGFRKSN